VLAENDTNVGFVLYTDCREFCDLAENDTKVGFFFIRILASSVMEKTSNVCFEKHDGLLVNQRLKNPIF